MTSAVSRLVPRRAPPAKADPIRTSEDVRADIARLEAEREAAAAAVTTLQAGRNAVLLTDDDAAAERHDAETARQHRIIERCDLRRPGLENELSEVEAREKAEREETARQEAEAAIAAVMAEIDAGYVAPARTIAAFMIRYVEANRKAEAAGVQTIDQRTRVRPYRKEPDRVETMVMYVAEDGSPSHQPYGGPMQYAREDAQGLRYNEYGQLYPPRRKDHFDITVTGREHPGEILPPLASLVNLPGANLGDPAFHDATGLEPIPSKRLPRLMA